MVVIVVVIVGMGDEEMLPKEVVMAEWGETWYSSLLLLLLLLCFPLSEASCDTTSLLKLTELPGKHAFRQLPARGWLMEEEREDKRGLTSGRGH